MNKKRLKLVSWNVNGMNAVMKKNFIQSFNNLHADIVGIQESKLQEVKLTDRMKTISGYESYWAFSTVKKGYSGVGCYTSITPQRVQYGIDMPVYDDEGRIIEMDFGNFIFFNIYFPNGQMSDERLKYKLDFYEHFFSYAEKYKKEGRSIIIAGDFNTAHNEIDLKNPKANEKRSGFLKIEREWLDRIIEKGYIDTFRYLYPDLVKYSWWSYRSKARERNTGWRIDYFFVTEDMISKGWIKDAFINNDIDGSDHCPVGLVMEI